jgi:hypothetical protein
VTVLCDCPVASLHVHTAKVELHQAAMSPEQVSAWREATRPVTVAEEIAWREHEIWLAERYWSGLLGEWLEAVA